MDTLPDILCEKIYDYVNDLYFIEHVHKLKRTLAIIVFMKKNYPLGGLRRIGDTALCPNPEKSSQGLSTY